MYVSLHVKYPLLLSDFNKTGIFSTRFQKPSTIKENLFSGSQVVPCGWMDGWTDRQT